MCYSQSSLLPWRSSARATVMRVVEQDRTSRTDITPLGSFCQKAQLRVVSQRRLLLCCSSVTGFLRDHNRWRRESGNQVAKSRTSICQRRSAKTPNSLNMGRTRHHGGDRKNRDGGHQVAFLALVGALSERLVFSTARTLSPSPISAVR